MATMARDIRLRNPIRGAVWFRSRWFRLCLFGFVLAATTLALVTGAPLAYVCGQLVLGGSVFVSLSLLAQRPLINPIQAFIALFYWWFGVGPVAIATQHYLMGRPENALQVQVSAMEALWIVAPGLLLYALAARASLRWLARTGAHARFLLPAGANYTPTLLIIYLSLAGLSSLLLLVLQAMGIQGQEETSFFGGTRTTIWWVGVIAAAGSLAPFVSSALMTALANGWKQCSYTVRVLILVLVAQTLLTALFGGMKSPLAALGATYACAYVCRWQRPPWLFMAVGMLIFILLITPYVNYGRHAALVSGAETSATREQIFREALKTPEKFLPRSLDAVNVSVFFRGIFPLASELTRRNDLFAGEWGGYTIVWGLEVPVPRVLLPTKRDSNIGNFFCRTVGADIGVSGRYDYLNNIAISIPFEFVGNYGWMAGVLSFGMLGVLWALACGWLLSPARLSSHPLTPMLVLLTLRMESPLGSFLGALRGLLIPLFLAYVIYWLLNGRTVMHSALAGARRRQRIA